MRILLLLLLFADLAFFVCCSVGFHAVVFLFFILLCLFDVVVVVLFVLACFCWGAVVVLFVAVSCKPSLCEVSI